MSDARAPDLPSLKVIRPGHRMGPKPPETGPKLPWTACSSLEAFSICPQYHAFAYDMGLRPTEDKEALVLGGLIHVGLAYHYGMRMNPRPAWMVYPTPEAPSYRDAIWTIGFANLDIAEKALRIVDAYVAHYSAPTLMPLLIEHQFGVEIPVGTLPEKYTLRIDMLAQDWAASGEVVLLDHKSAYKLTKWVGHDYRADREMLTGLALCRAHGYDVKRVVINAIQKGTKENPTPAFQRYDVPISETAYARIGAETAYWIQRMREVRQSHPDPENRPRAYASCVRKYGRCQFYPVCADGPQNLVQFTRKW